MLKDISISKKIILSFFVIYFILWSTFLYISITFVGGILTDRLIANSKATTISHANEVLEVIKGLESEILILSVLPELQKIINIDLEGIEYEQVTDRLEDGFRVISNIYGIYSQIRYIDETGQEIVRIDNNGTGAIKIAESDLQNKKDRYYFIETIALRKGQIFISPLDLNREGSPPQIEIPYLPVIRYGTPLFNKEGQRKGVIVIDVDASSFLEDLRDKNIGVVASTESILMDQDGYYFVHSNKNKEWGSPVDLDTGDNIKKDYLEYSERMLKGKTGYIDDGTNIVSYSPVRPYGLDSSRFWVHAMIIPKDIILEPVASLVNQLLLYGVFVLALSFILIYLYSRSVTKSIRELLTTVSKVSLGNRTVLMPVRSKDEIGRLAEAFNSILLKLKKTRAGIEKKVVDRTLELEKINNYMIGRELKMLELKKEIKKLSNNKNKDVPKK